IVEAARGRDEARVKDCADLISRLRALIIRDKSGMHRVELRCHAYAKFYGVEWLPESMFYESYPVALYDLGVHDYRVWQHTVGGDILDEFKNQHWQDPIAVQENALRE